MLAASPEITRKTVDSDTTAGLQGFLSAASLSPLSDVAFIRVTGDDRVRWLNGMVTNSIAALSSGEGCYCFFLNAQGRIQGDCTAWLLPDAILLETSKSQIEPLISLLERFIIMDDVELRPFEVVSGLLLAGPHAASNLSKLGLMREATPPLTLTKTSFRHSAVHLLSVHSPVVPRFELWADSQTINLLSEALRAYLPEASADDVEHLRLLEGTPLFGTDIRDRELPQETGQTRALHFAKGCYLGQEIVERIRSRGNVHRAFSGFQLDGCLAERGTLLFAENAPAKSIGELTSVARVNLPSGSVTVALGYVRREVVETRVALHYTGGVAHPLPLPFPLDLTAGAVGPA